MLQRNFCKCIKHSSIEKGNMPAFDTYHVLIASVKNVQKWLSGRAFRACHACLDGKFDF